MTESSQRRKEPYTFADKIFGVNPYPKDDPNQETWETNARLAAEEEAIFEAGLLKTIPVTPEQYARYVQDGMIGHFDILARRLLIVKFRSAESIAIYEDCLSKIMESMLTLADERYPPSVPKAPFLFALHRQFRQRIAHWTAEALKRMREGIASDSVSQLEASGAHGLKDGNEGDGTTSQGIEQGPDDATTPTNANTASSSRKGHRDRGPDKRKHRERGEFEDGLISELAAVRDRQNSAPTLDELRKTFPAFKLWVILSRTEQEELLEREFKPRAYARVLTARKFGVSEETIKKSRQTLKRQRRTPNA